MTTARDADKPFLIVHNMLLPHDPITDTPRDRTLGRPASLGNMIEYLDQLVGLTLGKTLESVKVTGRRIVSATMESGETIRAAMFVDATYGESLAGQWQQVSWKGVYQFCDLPISPYVEEDDPQSGLLPGIASDPAGKPGQGDYRIQAYNFRMLCDDSGRLRV